MTREQIIRMAREQGLPETDIEGVFIVNTDDLGRILSAERERLTDVAMKSAEKAVEVAMALEREACAKVCEEMRTYIGRNNAVTQSSAQDCAAAIRARGQA